MSKKFEFVLTLDTDDSTQKLQQFSKRLREVYKNGELSISQFREAQKSLDVAFEDTFDARLWAVLISSIRVVPRTVGDFAH